MKRHDAQRHVAPGDVGETRLAHALGQDTLRREAPELSAPILFSISKTLAARIRADNKRIKDSVNFARAAGQ